MEYQKKYELTNETIDYYGMTLYRIRALRDFGDVKAGEMGGFVKSGNNLSHEGEAWVFDNAKVFGEASVFGEAWVSDEARVFDNARVSGEARVSGGAMVLRNARLLSEAKISDYVQLTDNAMVSGNAKVSGCVEISGSAKVSGCVEISGKIEISGNAEVTSKKHFLCIGPIGSSNIMTFFRTADNGISVQCGCFSGTIEEFLEKVTETHGDNEYAIAYRVAVELAKACIKLESESLGVADKV